MDICKILRRTPKPRLSRLSFSRPRVRKATSSPAWSWVPMITSPSPSARKCLPPGCRRALCKGAEQNLDRSIIRIHDLTIDPSRCEALLEDRPLASTLSEFNILHVWHAVPASSSVATRLSIRSTAAITRHRSSDRRTDHLPAEKRTLPGLHRDRPWRRLPVQRQPASLTEQEDDKEIEHRCIRRTRRRRALAGELEETVRSCVLSWRASRPSSSLRRRKFDGRRPAEEDVMAGLDQVLPDQIGPAAVAESFSPTP